MTERERLADLIDDYMKIDGSFNTSDMAEHLLLNGVIVPPCKVGDTVYIFERGGYVIPICGQGKPHWEIKIEKCSFKYWLLDNHKFGENMFFTREEAENALKECEKK